MDEELQCLNPIVMICAVYCSNLEESARGINIQTSLAQARRQRIVVLFHVECKDRGGLDDGTFRRVDRVVHTPV